MPVRCCTCCPFILAQITPGRRGEKAWSYEASTFPSPVPTKASSNVSSSPNLTHSVVKYMIHCKSRRDSFSRLLLRYSICLNPCLFYEAFLVIPNQNVHIVPFLSIPIVFRLNYILPHSSIWCLDIALLNLVPAPWGAGTRFSAFFYLSRPVVWGRAEGL